MSSRVLIAAAWMLPALYVLSWIAAFECGRRYERRTQRWDQAWESLAVAHRQLDLLEDELWDAAHDPDRGYFDGMTYGAAAEAREMAARFDRVAAEYEDTDQ